jgi:two-component sensor histidine kinase
LQVIYSLLTLQELSLKDPAAINALRESKGRVLSMSFIHDKLLQSTDLSQVNFRDYIQKLVTHLIELYALDPGKVQLKIEVEENLIDLNTAIQIGLIVNELVSNSRVKKFNFFLEKLYFSKNFFYIYKGNIQLFQKSIQLFQ